MTWLRQVVVVVVAELGVERVTPWTLERLVVVLVLVLVVVVMLIRSKPPVTSSASSSSE